MTISQNDRNVISTCLYTELAKCYFLLGPFMAEENTDEICLCGRHMEIGFFIHGKPVWLCEQCDAEDED